MTATLFDLPSDPPFAAVAACHRCGARSERIEQTAMVPKPHLIALLALAKHERGMHPPETT